MGHEVTVLTGEKPVSGQDLEVSQKGFRVLTARSRSLEWFFSRFGINQASSTTHQHERFGSRPLRWLRAFRLSRGIMLIGRLPDPLDLLIYPSRSLLKDEHWDVVISTYAPQYCHAIASWLKSNGRCHYWIADFRDLWTQHHQFSGLFPFTLLERWLEQRYLRLADLVTTVSKDFVRKLKLQNSNIDTLVVPNGFDSDDLLELDPEPVFQDRYLHYVYTGTLYPGWSAPVRFLQGIRVLLDQEPMLKTGIRINFFGNDLTRLSDVAMDLRLTDFVVFHGLKPRDVALRAQRDADALIFFDPDKAQGIPTGKLYEYVNSGSEVWRIGPPKKTIAIEVLKETAAGQNVGWEPDEIAHQLSRLRNRPKQDASQSERERPVHYARKDIARELLEFASKQLR
jgi:glycosyltransferase involved in cell wall biosynthesis